MTIVRIEIDKHKDGHWQTYAERTTPGKGSNARSGAVSVARDLARTTIGTMRVRVRCESDERDPWVVWRDDWGRPQWR